MTGLTSVWRIARKDLRSEFRTKESLNAALSFAVVILLLFSFAFNPNARTIKEMGGGLLWLVYAFSGALILNRAYTRELPNDCLEVLVASPVPSASLFLGKAIASFLLILAIQIFCLPVFAIFYNVSLVAALPSLLLVLALGAWGLSAVGTLFSALTVNLRLRELMLPMLLYPMMIPALMAAMHLTTLLVAGEPWLAEDQIWLKLLITFDVIFTTLAAGLAEFILVR